MKRKNALKASLALLFMYNALFLTSCSSLWAHRSPSAAPVQKDAGIGPSSMIPKEQYDELFRKYQDLLALSKNKSAITSMAISDVPIAADPHAQSKPEVGALTVLDPSELVNRIDSAIPETTKLAVADIASKGPPLPASVGVQHINNTDDIDEQIVKLREVQDLVKVNKFDNALSILKELENSKERQVVVRAKMMLGDILFNQGEYDLASQIYDEVIRKYAFSSSVLKALGKLVTCSEKLKQPEKQAKYYSLLHDFFEAS